MTSEILSPLAMVVLVVVLVAFGWIVLDGRPRKPVGGRDE